MQTVRIFYKKYGRAKYLSHLDSNRLMQRALKRSGVPVWYTQGFNPHIYITFALPLSLGFESDCESMEIKLEQEMPFEEIGRLLNLALPEGIEVYRVAAPEMKPERIVWADYEVALTPEGVSTAALSRALMDFFSQESILLDKKSKKGMVQVEIAPWIKLLDQQIGAESVVCRIRTAAGITLNINPQAVCKLFSAQQGVPLSETKITRKAIYDADFQDFA